MKDDLHQEAECVSLQSVCAVLEKMLPLLSIDAIRSNIGERTVIFSDDSETPELRLEIIVLEDTPEYLHVCAYLSRQTSAYPQPEVVAAALIRPGKNPMHEKPE